MRAQQYTEDIEAEKARLEAMEHRADDLVKMDREQRGGMLATGKGVATAFGKERTMKREYSEKTKLTFCDGCGKLRFCKTRGTGIFYGGQEAVTQACQWCRAIETIQRKARLESQAERSEP